MVRLVNKAFQCLVVYNLDLRKTYDQIFHLLCLWRSFLTLEGAKEKLSASENAVAGLGVVEGHINSLKTLPLKLLMIFSYISWIFDGIKSTIRDLHSVLKDLEKDFI